MPAGQRPTERDIMSIVCSCGQHGLTLFFKGQCPQPYSFITLVQHNWFNLKQKHTHTHITASLFFLTRWDLVDNWEGGDKPQQETPCFKTTFFLISSFCTLTTTNKRWLGSQVEKPCKITGVDNAQLKSRTCPWWGRPITMTAFHVVPSNCWKLNLNK